MTDFNRLNFEYRLYDLYTEIMKDFRDTIYAVADILEPERLRGPLYTIIHELTANALKATYKRVFFKYLIEELGLEGVSYEDWLALFKTELEEHQAENFARVCRDKEIFISVIGVLQGDIFRIEIGNEGVPSEVELVRLRTALKRARGLQSLSEIFVDDDEDAHKEGGGMGLSLIVMSLRGLGIDPSNFSIRLRGDNTIARIDLPLAAFSHGASSEIRVLQSDSDQRERIWNLYREIRLVTMAFDLNGSLLTVSEGLLKRLQIPTDKPGLLIELIPDRFFKDLFEGPQNIRNARKFENYRIYVPTYPRDTELLFNISGYVSEDNQVQMLMQEVNIQGRASRFGEGSMMDNLMVHRLVEPYISPQILWKAREVAKLGKHTLPNEVVDVTIMFADLVGFTQESEHMEHVTVLELLSLSLGICSKTIEKNGGQVDKFMGDAVMAVFKDPLSAVQSAIDILEQFNQINEVRRLSGQPQLHIRLGINSGTVIMGNVGTDQCMDWTAIGDVVNTASRIERAADRDSLLISESTYSRIKASIVVDAAKSLKVKGKEAELTVYSVRKVADRPKTDGSAGSTEGSEKEEITISTGSVD